MQKIDLLFFLNKQKINKMWKKKSFIKPENFGGSDDTDCTKKKRNLTTKKIKLFMMLLGEIISLAIKVESYLGILA